MVAVAITRLEHGAADLRLRATRMSDADAVRRLLAIALLLEGSSREAAARATGMDRQTLRDWVHRYNAQGPSGLSDRKAPGRAPLLTPEQEEVVAGAIPEHARGKPVELWWQDEARVGQQGTLTYVWATKGSRPRRPRDLRYEWAYIFGAVCPARDTGVALVLPTVNIDMMNRHLAEISAHVLPGHHAVLTLDGAGWHQEGGKLKVPDNISLLHLPPYAPELNPVENIWPFLRQNHLSNRVFPNYHDILDACCNAWNALASNQGKIQSIATRDWAQVNL